MKDYFPLIIPKRKPLFHKPLLTVEQACKKLDVTEKRIYYLCFKGKLSYEYLTINGKITIFIVNNKRLEVPDAKRKSFLKGLLEFTEKAIRDRPIQPPDRVSELDKEHIS